VLILAIDTCDSAGSVAVLRDDEVLGLAVHETAEDYSSWLLPAVEGLVQSADLPMAEVEGYAVAAGPGSFTGVRVGLTTVKGWAEVYGKPIAAVSRLEAMAVQSSALECGLPRAKPRGGLLALSLEGPPLFRRPPNHLGQAVSPGARFVAAFTDARRGQVFGAVYRREDSALAAVGEEMVIAPGRFVEAAAELAAGEKIAWVSTDPAPIISEAAWKEREKKGEKMEQVSARLAPVIGRIGARLLREGKATDALALDANYVRRSDAEIFWKGGSAAHGR
jgi:tRNA threonylcarbamoyladenosine biosynthesis protein TsaB